MSCRCNLLRPSWCLLRNYRAQSPRRIPCAAKHVSKVTHSTAGCFDVASFLLLSAAWRILDETG